MKKNDEKLKTANGQSKFQRWVRALCWIPALGVFVEAYHVFKWGCYQSDGQNMFRWCGSVLWHVAGVVAIVSQIAP